VNPGFVTQEDKHSIENGTKTEDDRLQDGGHLSSRRKSSVFKTEVDCLQDGGRLSSRRRSTVFKTEVDCLQDGGRVSSRRWSTILGAELGYLQRRSERTKDGKAPTAPSSSPSERAKPGGSDIRRGPALPGIGSPDSACTKNAAARRRLKTARWSSAAF
jgi:hypothetical protein